MKLSDFLQQYIDEQGISGRELARRCDLAPQTIFNIMKGTKPDGSPLKVDTTTLAKIANGLGYYGARFGSVNGVTLISIPGVTDTIEETPVYQPETELDDMTEYLEDLRTRPELRILLRNGRSMTKDQIDAVVKMIENFK